MRWTSAVAAGAYLALFAVAALLAPVVAPVGPFHTSSAVLLPPTWSAPMGTDDLGRNVAVGVIYGARTSLLVALGVGAITGALGLAVGAIAGFAGGALDDLLMRSAEFVWVLPRFFLAIATSALFGGRVVALIVLLGVVSWPGAARVLRSTVLREGRLPYVEAVRAAGARPSRVLIRHVVPNSLAPFIVSITILAGNAILVEAGLSFLGLGDASSPSWGSMLRDAQPIMQEAPWAVAFPGAAVTLAVLAFNLLGDALLDALSPWSRTASATLSRDVAAGVPGPEPGER